MNCYISDLHLFHKNAINFDNRPFKDIEKMTEEIVKRWNSVVTDSDHVYLLGDILWKVGKENIAVLDRLNGLKHLITGNHDRLHNTDIKSKFVSIKPYDEINDTAMGKKYKLVLCHYPIMMWNGQHHGTIHLYGHIHTSRENAMYQSYLSQFNKDTDCKAIAINVGCMCSYMDYTPRTLEQLLTTLELFN